MRSNLRKSVAALAAVGLFAVGCGNNDVDTGDVVTEETELGTEEDMTTEETELGTEEDMTTEETELGTEEDMGDDTEEDA
jgi:uncharacterized lipoprotein NlpE involved in copper resistance